MIGAFRCPIDDTPFQTCGAGQDYMPLPPVDWPPPKGTTMTEPQDEKPQELKEYHYHIGYIEHTALLTEEMAETLGAKPVDEPLDEPGIDTNTDLRGSVLTSDGLKARTPRNKRA